MDGRLSGMSGSRASLAALVCLSIVACTADLSRGAETVGGAVYEDLANVLMSGDSGVTMTTAGTGGNSGTYTATTAAGQGLWQTADVPEGTYTVTPSQAGMKFWHMIGGKPDLQAAAAITVNQQNRAANQSIQFLASNVGGMIYADAGHTTGLSGVTMTLTPAAGNAITTTTMAATTGVQGWWQIGVPAGSYRVTPSAPGRTFTPEYVDIVAGTANLEANTTLQFAAGATSAKLAFTVQPSASYRTGQAISTQVTVQDASGATVGTSAASITLTLVPLAPATNTTLSGTNGKNAAAGVASFSDLTVATPGTYKFHAESLGLIAADSDPFAVTLGNAASLAFVVSPGRTPTGNTLTSQPQVEIRDSAGNRLATDSTSSVTVALIGSGTLGGTATVTASQGVATFADLTVGLPGTFPGQFHLTATSGSLSLATSGDFEVYALPLLSIAKSDSADPVDPQVALVYTIHYTNIGLGSATNTVIVEKLPAGLVFASCTGGGVYDATAKTITWDLGTLPAHPPDQTVTFTVSLDPSLQGGETISNADLTIRCDETGTTRAAVETTKVADKKPPVVTALDPAANQELVPIKPTVRLGIADHSGVDAATVKISVAGCLIFDGARATLAGEYDSTGADQAVRGICRRTGADTNYTFTFIPSVSLGYEKQVTVRVEAADKAGNSMPSATEYSFKTQLRTFGKNGRVNSYETLVQDNPATAVDPAGRIWVVWDQTNASGDGDIYVGLLPVGAAGFQASLPVAATAADERDPALATDASGVAYVAWQQQATGGHWAIYVCASTDLGVTWSPPVMVAATDPANPGDQILPAIVAGGTGARSLHVVWQENRGGQSNVWLGKSTDGGTTWIATQISQGTTSATGPKIMIDAANNVHVVWTDSRNAATTGTDIYGASSNDGVPWTNVPLVNTAGDQSGPAGAAGTWVHLAWVSGTGGLGDILYGNDSSSFPLAGTSMTDGSLHTVQRMPAVAVYRVNGADTVFACWEDGRDAVSGNKDTDIYFAESHSPFGTNILVNDDKGTSTQTKPAIGVNHDGDPYIVWVDNREGNNDIYYAGATAIHDNAYLGRKPPMVDSGTGKITIPSEKPNFGVVLPNEGVLPAGVKTSDISFQPVTNPPALPQNGFGLCYELGPSGTVFSAPITIQIPLPAGHAAYPQYNVYRYDTTNLIWTTDGIINPATLKNNADGDYLEVRVTHFSTFGTVGATPSAPAPSTGDGGGGGGCALTPWSGGSPVGYGLPFVAYVLVLLGVTCIDRLRRRP